jgi:hypothetical protein
MGTVGTVSWLISLFSYFPSSPCGHFMPHDSVGKKCNVFESYYASIPPRGCSTATLVGGTSHVGTGDGWVVYVNGRKLSEEMKMPSFKEGGKTDDPLRLWTGDVLMDLGSGIYTPFQALQMTVKSDILFVEAGGFSEKNALGWKCPLVVLKKK